MFFSVVFAQEEYVDPSRIIMAQMSRFGQVIDVDTGKEIFFWSSEMVDVASFRLIRELELLEEKDLKSLSADHVRMLEFLLKVVVGYGKAEHLMQIQRITDLAGQKLYQLPQYLGSRAGYFFGHKPSSSIHHQLSLKVQALARMQTDIELFTKSRRFDISQGVLLDAEQIKIAQSCMKFFESL